MLGSIDECQRARLVRAAVLLCATSLLLAPLAGQTSIEIGRERGAFGSGLMAPPVLPTHVRGEIAVRRDPFVADVAVSTPPASPPGDPNLPTIPTTAFALPANRGATEMALPQFGVLGSGAIVVRAVVTGERSRALIDADGTTRVVAAGDTIDGAKVRRIDAFGVELSSGQIYPLESATP